jgi:hypothetical protein
MTGWEIYPPRHAGRTSDVIDDFSAAPFEEIRESEPSASGRASKCGSLTTVLASSLEARRTVC